MPKTIELILFILALLVAVARVSFGLKAYNVRRHIFSGDKRFFRIGIITNFGYVVVALLLGVYFLLLYLDRNVTTPLLEAALLLLLVVLIFEATFRKRT